MKIRIGADPGKLGGIVAIYEDGSIKKFPTPLVKKEINIHKFQELLMELAGEMDSAGNWVNDVLVLIEDVHSLHLSGAKSNFQFGRALGILEAVVTCLGLPFVKIQPKTWQAVAFKGVPVQYKPGGKKKLNKKTGKEETTQAVDNKAMAAIAVSRLFPGVSFLASERCSTPHDGMVDAALMAYFLKVNY